MATSRSTPTVIVSRTVRPGREREFEAWLDRLLDEARDAPGFVGLERQPPSDEQPNEWVVIYRFVDAESLRSWVGSAERAALMNEGVDLCDGPAREQVVVLQRDVDPVTAVISVRVPERHRHMYLERYHEIDAAMTRAPGFIRTEMFEPVEGVQDETVVVFTFDGRDHLDAWMASSERAEILQRMEPFIEGSHTVNVMGGFGGWFDLDEGTEPKRWKQAAVVLLALYPTVMAITLVKNWLLPGVWLPLDILGGNIIGVAILTWVLMPVLTRLLDRWLRS